MKATADTTTKTTVRYLVQWYSVRDSRWYNYGGSYATQAEAETLYSREVDHRYPGTVRVVKQTIESTWEEILV